MRVYLFFLQLLGSFFLATILHELYHVLTKQVTVIGVEFGQGGFFVQGYGQSSETVAFIVTAFSSLILGGLVFYFNQPKQIGRK